MQSFVRLINKGEGLALVIRKALVFFNLHLRGFEGASTIDAYVHTLRGSSRLKPQ